MSQKSLAVQIRQSAMEGLSIECISIIHDVRKTDVLGILQEHYTPARAQKLWLRSIANNDFSKFIDSSIAEELFMELEGQPIVYSTMLGTDVFARKIIFKPTGIVNIDDCKEYVEIFSKDKWFIIAQKASNELGLCFAMFGPNEAGTNMEVKSTDEVPVKIINHFIRKAYNNLCDK